MLVGFAEVSAVISLLAMFAVLWLNLRRIKDESPAGKRLTELKEWQKVVDSKMKDDFDSIKTLRQELDKLKSYERLSLKAMKALLENAASGSSTGVMKNLQDDIDRYLIDGM
jgi:hypothetical protein